jgi:hypothetical protein
LEKVLDAVVVQIFRRAVVELFDHKNAKKQQKRVSYAVPFMISFTLTKPVGNGAWTVRRAMSGAQLEAH